VLGVIEALRRLRERFGDRIFLVSKCGKEIQKKSLHWLEHHDFYSNVGMRPSDVHFCRERHEKAEICRTLGITHFVDDRLEVLSYLVQLPKIEKLYLFRPRSEEVLAFKRFLTKVTLVNSWQHLVCKELPAE